MVVVGIQYTEDGVIGINAWCDKWKALNQAMEEAEGWDSEYM